MDNTTCIAVARHRKTGKVVAVNSWTSEGAASGKPLDYCERMNNTCKSHHDFKIMSMSWTEFQDKYPNGID